MSWNTGKHLWSSRNPVNPFLASITWKPPLTLVSMAVPFPSLPVSTQGWEKWAAAGRYRVLLKHAVLSPLGEPVPSQVPVQCCWTWIFWKKPSLELLIAPHKQFPKWDGDFLLWNCPPLGRVFFPRKERRKIYAWMNPRAIGWLRLEQSDSKAGTLSCQEATFLVSLFTGLLIHPDM